MLNEVTDHMVAEITQSLAVSLLNTNNVCLVANRKVIFTVEGKRTSVRIRLIASHEEEPL